MKFFFLQSSDQYSTDFFSYHKSLIGREIFLTQETTENVSFQDFGINIKVN